MKVAYIAGPFRGPTTWAVEGYVRRAESAALWMARHGAMPICPHTNTRYFNGLLTDQFWIDGTMELLRRCDVVILIVGWRESFGARHEEAEARKLGKPIFELIWHPESEPGSEDAWEPADPDAFWAWMDAA